MIIGKWNKSVILTYIGLISSVIGTYLAFTNDNILLALSCLLIAGVCDLFDGYVARKCKRTDQEKQFGIELDSLVDVFSFIALPISIFINLNLTSWYHLIIYIFFAICGIARLAYFNISLEEENKDKPIKYYSGLPVTYTAAIIPLAYLVTYFLSSKIIPIYYAIIIMMIAILNILNIKIRKPHGIAYAIFALLAIIVLFLFLVIL